MIIRLAMYLVLVAFALVLAGLVVDAVTARARRALPASRGRTGSPAHDEGLDRITRFLDSRQGVEAFLEPRTLMHPLSVVLVAWDGEWIRVALQDEAQLRRLARVRPLPLHDVMKTGYPERMRTFRRRELEGRGDS